MQLVEALKRLKHLGVPVFQTADAAAYLGIDRAHASQLLGRLAKMGHLLRLKRSIFAFPEKVEAIQLPQLLLAPQPCYLSLQTALYHHGMIDQIPHVIYAVSLARTQKIPTPLATVSVHHVDLKFFFGFEKVEKTDVFMACPEKALLDIFYLTPARSRIFKSLPEIELPTTFSFTLVSEMVEKIPYERRRKLVQERMQQLLD